MTANVALADRNVSKYDLTGAAVADEPRNALSREHAPEPAADAGARCCWLMGNVVNPRMFKRLVVAKVAR